MKGRGALLLRQQCLLSAMKDDSEYCAAQGVECKIIFKNAGIVNSFLVNGKPLPLLQIQIDSYTFFFTISFSTYHLADQ